MDHLQRTARQELRKRHLGARRSKGSDHNRSHQARLGGRDAFKRQEVVGRRSSFLRSRLIIRDFHFGFPYRRLYTQPPLLLPDPFSKEVHQLTVHFVRMGPGDAVRPSFTTNKRAPLISLAVRSPEALIGRIRSASPCMTKPTAWGDACWRTAAASKTP